MILAAGGADKPEQSLDAFEKAARQGRSESAAAGEIDAAKLLVSQGKTTEAIERLKRAIDSPKTAAPRDALLFTLAQIYEQTRRPVRRARDLPAIDHGLPDLGVPFRGAPEGPALLSRRQSPPAGRVA